MKKQLFFVGILFLSVIAFGQKKFSDEAIDQFKSLQELRTHYNDYAFFVNLNSNTALKSSFEMKQRLDTTMHYKWDTPTQVYNLLGNAVFTYDGANCLNSQSYIWKGGGIWENNSKREYTNDNSGKLTESQIFVWEEAQWNLNSREQYFYNESGKIDTLIVDVWKAEANQWISNGITSYTYDNGKIIGTLLKAFDATTGVWKETMKREITYNNNSDITEILIYLNEAESNEDESWILRLKDTYTYSSDGVLESHTTSFNFNGWNEVGKETYTYDTDYSLSKLLFPQDMDIDPVSKFQYKLLKTDDYILDLATSQWDTLKTEYKYSTQNINAINNQSFTDKINLYPNPSSDYIQINVSDLKNEKCQFEIFDIQGKKVMDKQIRNNERINVKSLKRGLYIYNLRVQGKSLNGKLLIQ